MLKRRLSHWITAPQHSTEDGANTLAGRLKTYWANRGYDVAVKVMPLVGPPIAGVANDTIFCVRSDMVDGMPARLAAKLRLAA